MSQDVENIEYASILALQALDQEFPLRKKASSEYLGYLDRRIVIPESCTVMVLIYLRRLRAAGSALTVEENFTSLTLCVTLMMAYKFICGRSKTNKSFARVSGITLTKLDACEILFLQEQAWNVFITPEEFSEACAQLERVQQVRMWRIEDGLACTVQRFRQEKKRRIEALDSA